MWLNTRHASFARAVLAGSIVVITLAPAQAFPSTAGTTSAVSTLDPFPAAPAPKGPHVLNDVAMLSPSNGWAVGQIYDFAGVDKTLVKHWDGAAWHRVPSPYRRGGVTQNELAAVSAVSPSDIWAVGDSQNSGQTIVRTLIEHWNGTAWSIVPSPDQPQRHNWLSGVVAISANDVWAVGSHWLGNSFQILTEHWDGTAWSIVPAANPSPDRDFLADVSAVSPNNIWAVGAYDNPDKTLIEHWDGTGWNHVDSPTPPGQLSQLSGVEAISSTDVWVTGENYDAEPQVTFTEHWDGHVWTTVPAVNPGEGGYSRLGDITSTGASDLWAVGDYYAAEHVNTLVEHWNGRRWTQAASPSPHVYNYLMGVDALSHDDIWAVGDQDQSVLFEHWNGTQWSLSH